MEKKTKRIVRLKHRKCLKCDKTMRVKRREPGICENCKRHVDWKDGEDSAYGFAG